MNWSLVGTDATATLGGQRGTGAFRAPSLLGAGPLSDRYGRRPLVLPFTVLAGIASLLFAGASDSYALLLLARFVQGLDKRDHLLTGLAMIMQQHHRRPTKAEHLLFLLEHLLRFKYRHEPSFEASAVVAQ